ncbi:MAG: hypothetical protein ACP5FZ_03345 [Fidelibacterota bacterium]
MKVICKYLLPIFLVSLICQSCGLSSRHLSNRAFLRHLSGLEYRIDNQVIQLAKGKYMQKKAPDATSEMVVALSDWLVLGDLNGDRQADAAVILITNSGGNGKYYYLVPVLRQDNQHPLALNAFFVGERISIVSLNIEDQQIDLVYLDREPGDSMATLPKIEIRRRFSIKSDTLAEIQLIQDLYVKR